MSSSIFCFRVPEFAANKFLVTNKEFLAFVKDGGYRRRELWTEEGKLSGLIRTFKKFWLEGLRRATFS